MTTTGDDPVRVLLVTGSTRAGSTNTAALRTAAAARVPGVTTAVWERLVELPAFVPGDEAEPHPALADLRREIAAAGAVVFSTPEYAGTLPGSLKNALDWLVGSGELYGKPVAWVGVGAPGRGEGAERTLALVLGYVGAEIVEAACVRIPVGRELVGPDGTVHDPAVQARLAEQLATLAAHVRKG
jgi:chromate reductase, NAD(P)H dehydrogenase (quinone)